MSALTGDANRQGVLLNQLEERVGDSETLMSLHLCELVQLDNWILWVSLIIQIAMKIFIF